MSGKLKSQNIIILSKRQDIDKIIARLLPIISQKSSGEQVGRRYIRIIMRADLCILSAYLVMVVYLHLIVRQVIRVVTTM